MQRADQRRYGSVAAVAPRAMTQNRVGVTNNHNAKDSPAHNGQSVFDDFDCLKGTVAQAKA
jgi:hypothetical protein